MSDIIIFLESDLYVSILIIFSQTISIFLYVLAEHFKWYEMHVSHSCGFKIFASEIQQDLHIDSLEAILFHLCKFRCSNKNKVGSVYPEFHP